LAIRIVQSLLQVYSWLIIARVLIAWFAPRPGHPWLMMVCRLTDPFLAFLRPMVPIRGIDLSPILALLLVRLISMLLSGI